MAEIELPATPTAGAEAIARIATDIVLEDVVRGRMVCLVLVTRRGQRVRVWQLHDVTQPDEVMRAIAQRDGAEAVAAIHPTATPPEVTADHVFLVAGEADDDKFDVLIALRRPAADDGGRGWEEFQIYGRRHSEPHHRWFGVEPDIDMELWEEGPIGLMGRGGDA